MPKGRKQEVSERLGLVFGFFSPKIQIHYQNKEIHNGYDACRPRSTAVNNI